MADYAVVNPSGNVEGAEIKLDDVLKHLKPFKLRAPFAWIVGGLAVHGKTKGDIDVLVRAREGELSPELWKALTFRIQRALPPELAERVQFLTSELEGPITDNVPLYDLEATAPERKVVRMDLRGDGEAVKAVQPAKFFRPMKPTLAAEPHERLTLDSLKRTLQERGTFPSLVQKKLDGLSAILWKRGKKVGAYSDDGKDLSNSLALADILLKLREHKRASLVLVGELEAWRGDMHLPRDVLAGIVHSKTGVPEGVKIMATLHDILYIDGEDLTQNRPGEPADHEEEGRNTRNRFRILGKLGAPVGKAPLLIVPSEQAADADAAVRLSKKMGALKGSEGALVKAAESLYKTGTEAPDWFKWRHNAVVTALVVEPVETKVKGVFNYHFGFRPPRADKSRVSPGLTRRVNGGEVVVYSGKTFSTDREYKRGDLIAIEATTVNSYPKTGQVTLWLPRVLDDKHRAAKAFTTPQVVEAAKREPHVLVVRGEKPIDAATFEKWMLEAADDEMEKARRTPWNQWGGSNKYAKRLLEKIPPHTQYAEPFCGAAAVFFVKERAEKESLADTDAEVIFALKFIRGLTRSRFNALKRYDWKVSRAGFKRVLECKPKTDPQRFWKFVYGRACRWGGIPTTTGYSTMCEGQTYDLDSLWGFHKRLKGTQIFQRDWKQTLKDCDGAGAFFFIDPPYAKEWGDGSGIPAEEIAAGVVGLKGRFIIAYTDSAKTRKAFAKTGRFFKMRLLEGTSRGGWKKGSRLFIASFNLKKAAGFDPVTCGEVEKAKKRPADPFMRYPDEDKVWRYGVQEHFRGRSVHGDLRLELEKGKTLIGWTLNTQVKGAVKEPVETMAAAKAWAAKGGHSKIDFRTGEWAKRRKGKALVNVEIVSERKGAGPFAWLGFEGVVEPGGVGATREHVGVLNVVDKGEVEYGSMKSHLHEYFLDSSGKGGLSGRHIFRQLEVGAIRKKAPEFVVPPAAEVKFPEEAAWFFIKAVDQTPYVLSTRAISEGWLPPEGISALPRDIRKRVPNDLRYWEASGKAALDRRRDLRKLFLREDILKAAHLAEKAAFVLQWRSLCGEDVGVTRQRYVVSLDLGEGGPRRFTLSESPLEHGEAVARLERGAQEDGTEGEFAKLLDRGGARMLGDDGDVLRVHFAGKRLKGVWLFERRDDAEWRVRRVEATSKKS